MTYRELQSALKPYKQQGKTTIALNAKKCDLESELQRLEALETTEQPTEQPIAKVYSFSDMVSRKQRTKPQGFAPKREKRFDELDDNEWREWTLSILEFVDNVEVLAAA